MIKASVTSSTRLVLAFLQFHRKPHLATHGKAYQDEGSANHTISLKHPNNLVDVLLSY